MSNLYNKIADNMDTVKSTIQHNTPGVTANSSYIQALLNAGYAFAGVVAVACIIYAGISYSTSNGEPEKAKKATRMLIYSVIGLLVIILAVVITNLIFAGLQGG